MARFAVVLSGCGVYDGSEIFESVLTLLNLDRNNIEYQCFAPDDDQLHVINHLTGDVMEGETRNVLIEASRIPRGNIEKLESLHAENFDAIIFPGGYGAAKNLSNFATEGTEMTIHPEVERVARAFYSAGKPAGYMCIAPTIAAAIYGDDVKCTVGNDDEVAKAIEGFGAKHVECAMDDIVVDETKKLVTTPAYMYSGKTSEADQGIGKLVEKLIQLVN